MPCTFSCSQEIYTSLISTFWISTILNLRNLQVHKTNAIILKFVAHQEKFTYLSADSVTDQKYNYVLPEVLHTLNPSGFSLHQLKLKIGAPLMLLYNLDPIHGLYHGTHLRLITYIDPLGESICVNVSSTGHHPHLHLHFCHHFHSRSKFLTPFLTLFLTPTLF